MRRVWGLAAALAAGICLLDAPTAIAANLPAWTAEIVESAPAPERASEQDDWRILLSDTHIEVQPDGTLFIRRRLAAQALQDGVSSIGIGAYRFDDNATILKARAWHLLPSGKARRSRGPAIDFTLDPSVLTDAKVRLVPVTGAGLGSLAFFEFEGRESPETLTFAVLFFEGAPVDVARFAVRVPPAWTLRHDWLRIDGPDPQVRDGAYVWELPGLPGRAKVEPLGESALDRAPMLVLAFSPPEEGPATTPAAVSDWKGLAGWYDALARGKHEATAQIRSLRDSQLGGDLGLYERIRTTGRYVRDNVRYVANEIGIGGYQPRPADQVLLQKYGDCKDKGTLFRSLLAADGIHSYAILVNASSDGTVSPEVPATRSFDHFVVGIPLPADVAVPSELAAATLDVDDFGPLLVVDTTDERTAIGSLPGYLAGKRALLVAGPRSRLIDIPDDDATAHRIERSLTVDLSDEEAERIVATASLFGEPAAREREIRRTSAQEHRRAIEAGVDRAWPGARIEELLVEEENERGAYEERIEFSVEGLSPGQLVPLFPDVLDDLPRVALDRRETAVVYPHPVTLRCRTTVIGAGGQGALPDLEIRGSGWSVVTAHSREDDVLQASFVLELSRPRFEPTEFEELRRLWSAVRRAASTTTHAD